MKWANEILHVVNMRLHSRGLLSLQNVIVREQEFTASPGGHFLNAGSQEGEIGAGRVAVRCHGQ
jgi:hypothetical protein